MIRKRRNDKNDEGWNYIQRFLLHPDRFDFSLLFRQNEVVPVLRIKRKNKSDKLVFEYTIDYIKDFIEKFDTLDGYIMPGLINAENGHLKRGIPDGDAYKELRRYVVISVKLSRLYFNILKYKKYDIKELPDGLNLNGIGTVGKSPTNDPAKQIVNWNKVHMPSSAPYEVVTTGFLKSKFPIVDIKRMESVD